jgi:hypothetical protein
MQAIEASQVKPDDAAMIARSLMDRSIFPPGCRDVEVNDNTSRLTGKQPLAMRMSMIGRTLPVQDPA